MIAALFVDARGCYAGLEGVDAWDRERDARMYPGMYRVVAHPPCERWGRFHDGGFGRNLGLRFGDDGGCFESALASLRKWGGVLEHPRWSGAWQHFGISAPPSGGGWGLADRSGDLWTCEVEQGHYGHRAPKPTWLLACRCALPELKWGGSKAPGRLIRPLDQRRRDAPGYHLVPKRERWQTPVEFRDLLLAIAAAEGDGPTAPTQMGLEL